MPGDQATTQSTLKNLITLYHAIQEELKQLRIQLGNDTLSDARADQLTVTHNFLRARRNELVELMILSLKTLETQEISAADPNHRLLMSMKGIVDTYVPENENTKGEPNAARSTESDRNHLRRFQSLLKKRKLSKEAITTELEQGMAHFLGHLQRTQESDSNIKYSEDFNLVLRILKKRHPKGKDQDSLYDDLLMNLRSCIEMRDEVLDDAGLRRKEKNPFVLLGKELLDKIDPLPAEDPARIKKVYLALQMALSEINHGKRGKFSGKDYNNLGLEKFIKEQLKQIEKLHPHIKTDVMPSHPVNLQWEAYKAATHLAIDKIEAQARSLEAQTGDHSAATELSKIAGQMRQATIAYYDLSLEERRNQYSGYQTNINELCQARDSRNLQKHTRVKALLGNVSFVVKTLGLGLIWLYATKSNRGSFWIRTAPLDSLKETLHTLEAAALSAAKPGKKTL